MAAKWSIVVPAATINLFHDPSFELADPDTEWFIFGDGGGGVDFTRSTTHARYGLSSALSETGASAFATIGQTIWVTATMYTLSARVYYAAGALTAMQCQAYFNGVASDWDSVISIGNNWWLCIKTAVGIVGDQDFGVQCNMDGLYVDACQLENLAYRTTYCDGTQEGCYWNGAAHTSSSSRSAQSLAGGWVHDLADFETRVIMSSGIGMPPLIHNYLPYALLPGAMYQNTKVPVRSMIVTLEVIGESRSDLHALRKALIDVLKPDQVAKPQPVILLYQGRDDNSPGAPGYAMRCLYEAGLEFEAEHVLNERVAIRFLCLDPFWSTWEGESVKILDSNDTATHRYLSARVGGSWNAACLPAAGAAATVKALVWGPDNRLYVGGDFTNWAGDGNCDYIARWDPVAGTWAALGRGADSHVNALCFGPDGNLYVGGEFTTVIQHDGAALTVRTVARWNLTSEHWEVLGPPAAPGTAVYTSVNALCFDNNGYLWVGGDFDNFNNNANADGICYWNGAAWVAPAAGCGTSIVCALAKDLDGNIWVGGTFSGAGSIGGVACDRIAYWNGATYVSPGGGLDSTAAAFAVAANGDIYVGGEFHNNSGATVSMDHIGRWDGAAWHNLCTGTIYDGVSDGVVALSFGPDGVLWLAGAFVAGPDAGRLRMVARYNGSGFVRCDIDIGGGIAFALAIGHKDPVVIENYDVYVGHNVSAATQFAGSAAITNAGSATAHPRFVVARSGGTSAIMVGIRNETTGKEIVLPNYYMRDGETITIDLRPLHEIAISTFRGNILGEISPGSDFATWALQPGANTVTCLVEMTGAPTITAYLIWNDLHWSAD